MTTTTTDRQSHGVNPLWFVPVVVLVALGVVFATVAIKNHVHSAGTTQAQPYVAEMEGRYGVTDLSAAALAGDRGQLSTMKVRGLDQSCMVDYSAARFDPSSLKLSCLVAVAVSQR